MTASGAATTLLVGTADGARLTADLCLPAGDGPFPAVLIRTPYDRRRHRAELRAWAASGFAALAQDVRGRYASEGQWHPYRSEEADGAATVRRLREQPWSNGQVVAHGSSYGAHCALAAALGASHDLGQAFHEVLTLMLVEPFDEGLQEAGSLDPGVVG
ncbi:CocE/NonD family hydrolase, partial [Streptomyces sp. 24-1644]|uniref:CocE/NonD family hydrolase n=1 Tax=Streptomyces sp. 24-1644 TaxID=3457315 RepID=UPI003FA72B7C